jgi:hypothetical protein
VSLLKGCFAALFSLSVFSQASFAARCEPPEAAFSTQVFSRLGVIEEASWVGEPFEAGNPKLDLFGVQKLAVSTRCVDGFSLGLDRSMAVAYRGGLNTLKLLLSDEAWQGIVPQGSYRLGGTAEAWDWWSLGFDFSVLTLPMGNLQVSPRLVSLVGYERKSFAGSVTRTGEVASLTASYDQLGFDKTGFLRDPSKTHSSLGASLSVTWTSKLNDHDTLLVGWENLWSHVPLKNAWWGRSSYQLNNASVINSTDTFARDNEVSGNYGQRNKDIRLPSIATVGLMSSTRLLAGARLVVAEDQIHSVVDLKQALGPGAVEISLVDTGMVLIGYRLTPPGDFLNITVGWAWGRYGFSSPLPLRLSVRF